MTGTVVSINLSEAKGTKKLPVEHVHLTSHGLAGDAHAGPWHRQVSLLAQEKVTELGKATGRPFAPGEFAENILTAGLDLTAVGLRDRIRIGETELEVTQIGKSCHGSNCSVFQEVSACIMPTDGIFARVVREGEIHAGDTIEIVKRPLKFAVITVSDRAHSGIYEDASGPAIEKDLAAHFSGTRWHPEFSRTIVADDTKALQRAIQDAVSGETDVIFTTGGTGIGPRDVTPEAVKPLIDKEIPGIMEHIRGKYAPEIPAACLSRGIAGTIGSTLVYTLPGSPRAVKQYLAEILRSLEHALLMLWGIDAH